MDQSLSALFLEKMCAIARCGSRPRSLPLHAPPCTPKTDREDIQGLPETKTERPSRPPTHCDRTAVGTRKGLTDSLCGPCRSPKRDRRASQTPAQAAPPEHSKKRLGGGGKREGGGREGLWLEGRVLELPCREGPSKGQLGPDPNLGALESVWTNARESSSKVPRDWHWPIDGSSQHESHDSHRNHENSAAQCEIPPLSRNTFSR